MFKNVHPVLTQVKTKRLLAARLVSPSGIRIVIAPAIRNRPIVLGKSANLVCPIPTIAQRPVDKNHWRSE